MSTDILGNVQHKNEWDTYWLKQSSSSKIYGKIASFYRTKVIAPSLRRTLGKIAFPNFSVLHAGSGGGEIDVRLPSKWRLTSVDISIEAVRRHCQTFAQVGRESDRLQADLFLLPFGSQQFDAVFNLGVMEHFTDSEAIKALQEMRRVVKSDGHVILYWPPVWGPSVLALHTIAYILRLIGRSNTKLHPAEINLFRSRKRCRNLLVKSGLRATRFRYGPGDLFTHVIIKAKPV